MDAHGGLEAGGLLLVDKPRGMTSHDVVAGVRKLVRPLRVGHTGTLDPLATGLLILCIGKATRVAQFLEAEYKVYRATVLLGLQTETQDIEGAVIARRTVGDISAERIDAVARSLTGWIEQQPPAFSALKVRGERAYRLARRREPVRLKPRRIEIRRLLIEQVRLPAVEFVVECSKGTYVRALCSDIGTALGVGGCLESLRRLEIGRFSLADATPVSRLNEPGDVLRALVPLSEALAHLPAIVCTDEQVERLLHGIRIQVSGPISSFGSGGEWVCAFQSDGQPLALGRIVSEADSLFFQPKKLLVVR